MAIICAKRPVLRTPAQCNSDQMKDGSRELPVLHRRLKSITLSTLESPSSLPGSCTPTCTRRRSAPAPAAHSTVSPSAPTPQDSGTAHPNDVSLHSVHGHGRLTRLSFCSRDLYESGGGGGGDGISSECGRPATWPSNAPTRRYADICQRACEDAGPDTASPVGGRRWPWWASDV